MIRHSRAVRVPYAVHVINLRAVQMVKLCGFRQTKKAAYQKQCEVNVKRFMLQVNELVAMYIYIYIYIQTGKFIKTHDHTRSRGHFATRQVGVFGPFSR